MPNEPTKPCPGCGLHYHHRDNCTWVPEPPLPSLNDIPNDPTWGEGTPEYRPALIVLAAFTAAFAYSGRVFAAVLFGAAFLYYLAKSHG